MVTWFGFSAPQALRASEVVISNAGTARRDLFMRSTIIALAKDCELVGVHILYILNPAG